MQEIVRSPLPDPAIPDGRLDEVVLSRLDGAAQRVAIVEAEAGRPLSGGELVARIEGCAEVLRRSGIGPGDVVAVLATNGPEFPMAFFGALRAGAACAAVNPAAAVAEIRSQVRGAGVGVVLATPAAVGTAIAATRESGVGVVEVDGPGVRGLVAPSGRRPGPVAEPQVAAMLLSSGTTGPAKNVMLTHRNLLAHAVQCGVWGLTPDDTVIAVSPFSHSMGMSALLVHALYAGVRLVTMPRFVLAGYLAAVQTYGASAALLAPPAVRALADDPLVDRYDLSSLRWVLSGAAALPVDVGERCAARLRRPVSQAWGMTECGLVASAAPDRGRSGSVGPPVAGVELAVVDPDTGTAAAPGSAGEILVRGPNVMCGYLGDEQATAAAQAGQGWLRTGDLGRVDPDGYVTLLDRLKEMIKYKGFQVVPAELEALLRAHPAVLDAAVVPSPDDVAGEVPMAYLVLRPGVDPQAAAREAVDWVASQVATYKRVRRYEVLEEMPRTPSGKLLRRLLVARERARSERA